MKRLLTVLLLTVIVAIASITQFHDHCHSHCHKARSCALHLSSFDTPRHVDNQLSMLDIWATAEDEINLVVNRPGPIIIETCYIASIPTPQAVTNVSRGPPTCC